MRNKIIFVIIPIIAFLLIWFFGVAGFVIFNTPTASPTPVPTNEPTNEPTTFSPTNVPTLITNQPTIITNVPTNVPTGVPTSQSPTNAPTASLVPTNFPTAAPTASTNVSACVCPPNSPPLYNTFPHPLHTNDSFIQLNFLNDRGVDRNGNNLTVYITVAMTADGRMQQEDPRFMAGFTYIYLDGFPLSRGQTLFFTIPYNNTGAGRMTGGRIHVYYENPATTDPNRVSRYPAGFPLQSILPGVPITNALGQPILPTQSFQGLLEFTVDHLNGTNPLTQSFVHYDYSAVDSFALPMYIYGGYDPLAPRNIQNNHTCNKAYVACQTTQAIETGCPTELIDNTSHGATCVSSFHYCTTGSNLVQNLTNWNDYCHRFDALAAAFAITQSQLDFFNNCANGEIVPQCPQSPLRFLTPSAIIYGCVGQFLLENHCLAASGAIATQSRLTTDQCAALNRGVCFTPNPQVIPPEGLACAFFTCTGSQANPCFVPCFDYSCFDFLCAQFDPSLFPNNATCNGLSCPFNAFSNNCFDNTNTPDSQVVVSTCNSSTPNPYTYPGQVKNEYAAMVRSKGERIFAFALDETALGGDQSCLFSTQLDVVIYPACNGTWPS